MRRLMVLALLAAPAAADTLPDAIAAAYATNPDLAQQRAIVRQADEAVPQALALGRPTLAPEVSFTENLTSSFGDSTRVLVAGGTINQPIYRGGRTRAAVHAGERRIEAARQRLRATENQVVVNVVTAYADVLRTAAIVQFNQNNVRVLQRQLQASRDRFQVGDVTRTDVAQSDARLALANSQLVTARGQALAAAQAYRRVVGRPPVALAALPPIPALPKSADEAAAIATTDNPDLQAARFDESAAQRDIQVTRGERLPLVTASAGIQYEYYRQTGSGGGVITGTGTGTGIGTGTTTPVATGGGSFTTDGVFPVIGVTASIPLFTGGVTASRVRQAQARQSETLQIIASTDRMVTESAINGFQGVETARGQIQSAEVQVQANTLALEGVRQENSVGARTILDVLNAEQELLNSQVTLAQARRDEYVAAFTLLQALGRAEAVALGAPVEPYDPAANARRVRHKWGEFSYDRDPAATPDVDHAKVLSGPPAQ